MPSILCFGDSNTHGTMPMASLEADGRYDAATRWPGVMAAALGTGWEVVAEGQPGRTTVHPDPVQGPVMDGLTVLQPLLDSHRPLDLVIIMLGTNDLKARFGLPPFDIAEGCYRLTRTVRTSDAGPGGTAPSVLLVCPPPILETGWIAEMFAGGAAKSRAVPPYLKNVARDADAAFFDAGSVIEVDPLDGIHLSAEAHAALGRALADEARAMLA